MWIYLQAADVPLSIDHYRYFAGWADKLQGKVRTGVSLVIGVGARTDCLILLLRARLTSKLEALIYY